MSWCKCRKDSFRRKEIIKDWKANRIKEALIGYRTETYGHKMKAVIKGQVGKFTDDEINAVSEYVPTLNK